MPISQSYDDALAQVNNLVERFRRNLDAYHKPEYKEAQVRIEFINPFLEALGWDVNNVQGYAEQYKDVVHEDSLRVGGAVEAPDYCFRIGGTRKFFLEAKKPSVALRTDVGPAYQLRRYAWSAKLPLSILTDFEELAIYDCASRPAPSDGPGVARVRYITFDEYPERFREVYDIFARESLLRGSFDRYAQDTRGKRGTSEVDAEFLKTIESWREVLARNIALRNPTLSVHELNFAVQATIDRILFLRMAEGRGIEPYAQLQALTAGQRVYPRLVDDLYRRADEKYNSGLFDFDADTLSGALVIDDKVLKPILAGLYYPECPYEFSVLPVEVLGQVYEQFLGKVIRLTAGHRAEVEEKPEVRKAGGVYYTPAYIVDHIVKQTVGKLVEGKSPRELRGARGASPLRVLDPACGSGSFLLGAYQHLLEHYRRWYEANGPEKHASGKEPAVRQGPRGEWLLTTAEKKRILLDHIYGVDIDRQAVEVTKLSLLLKVLEGETGESIGSQLAFWHERALPDLGTNIQCGNSLIGPEYFEGQMLVDEEELRRVNPFDWKRGFPEAMGAGGFDAVIGNPPYIRIQTMKEWAPNEVAFYGKRYAAAGKGNYDIYVVFVERALQLLNERGRMGFILPNKFLTTDYGRPLREAISAAQALTAIVDFGHHQVFEQATTYTCLLFLQGSPTSTFDYIALEPMTGIPDDSEKCQTLASSGLNANIWTFSSGVAASLVDRLATRSVPLLELPADISRGSSTGDDTIFVLHCAGIPGTYRTVRGDTVQIEPEVMRTPVFATDFSRYRFDPGSGKAIVFPYGDDSQLLVETDIKARFPKAYGYLAAHKRILEQRKQYRVWYGYSAPRNLALHDSAQLVVPLLANRGLFAELPAPSQKLCLMASGGFSVTVSSASGLHKRYVLGLLNSRLLFWRLNNISNKFRGGWITCTKQYVGTLPIRTIDFADPADVARHDRMVALVERMLELHKKLAAAGIPADKALYERQIDATDRQIDALVYELYGLTAEEIGIVEGSG